MTIELYNTKTRTLEPLRPIEEGKVGIYVCGATVQGAPHLGHMRSAVVFDQLRRWLTYRGLEVTLIRNVTDIDDKILTKSAAEGRPWWAHAYLYERAFTSAYNAMGVLPPTYEPRATGHIPEMVRLIQRLLDAGFAYRAPDGSGDVYFDTAAWPDYGALTHQNPADMAVATDADPRGKRSPHDFALWKGHKAGEPATAAWDTPWGRGRPGWHIECSAMSTKYLGESFDIHGGGLDLRFPHHENEMAQANAAGDGFARLWMHSGLLNVGGDKMSKSLGNSIFALDLMEKFHPITLRYFLSTAHYRSVLEFSEDLVRSQQASLGRLRNFLSRARRDLGELAPELPNAADGYSGIHVEVPGAFAAAMDDDLSIPKALAVVFDHVTSGFKLLEVLSQPDRAHELAHVVAEVELMLDILGVNPSAPNWGDDGNGVGSNAADRMDQMVEELLKFRLTRKNQRDYAAADAIRDAVQSIGISVEDTSEGFRWWNNAGDPTE